jgi:hypothetical protein
LVVALPKVLGEIYGGNFMFYLFALTMLICVVTAMAITISSILM